jgi:hypothetical protein
MQYMVLKANSRGGIIQLVTGSIADGWTPQGGISVSGGSERSSRRYVQAMVKD